MSTLSVSGKLLEYASQVAADLAETHANNPVAELGAWLRVSIEREAMVTRLYSPHSILDRLTTSSNDPAVEVVRDLVNSIWAHEESHTATLAAHRSLIDDSSSVSDKLYGRLQGMITGTATSENMLAPLARVAISLGATTRLVPEFATELANMTFKEFCEFSVELEETAVLGYTRIITILSQIPLSVRLPTRPTLRYTIARTREEECFHRAAFALLSSWCDGDDFIRADLSAAACTGAVLELAKEYLSVAPVSAPAPYVELSDPTTGEEDDPSAIQLFSDGGLKDFFQSRGIRIQVIPGGRVRIQER